MAIDVLKRAKDPLSRESIRDAIIETNLTTLAGPVSFKGGPVANVGKAPVLGGQWVKGKVHRYDLRIVDMNGNKMMAAEGKMQLL